MNKTIKLNAKDIIATRDKMSDIIKKNWKIIRTTNVMPTKAIKAGLQKYDLNQVYNDILQSYQKQLKCKLLLNAINNGIAYNDNVHYKTIYEAQALKEQYAQWSIILDKSTINPATKAKAGAKGTGKKETFSSAKITSIKKKLELQILALDKEIADFNDKTSIEVSADEFGDFFKA